MKSQIKTVETYDEAIIPLHIEIGQVYIHTPSQNTYMVTGELAQKQISLTCLETGTSHNNPQLVCVPTDILNSEWIGITGGQVKDFKLLDGETVIKCQIK